MAFGDDCPRCAWCVSSTEVSAGLPLMEMGILAGSKT